ncbi:TrmH family RNA methyltransferase [Actinopolymorpha rutila]|uniref:TrmH family RNA methyltransferase n=1 Tax=Actinopolymorpha rutila TaxID=446787 RepID=A0A852ZUK0_9ACTN|nr:TrmH family RNA methyltransferase [Actinopolymorpha rutila]
MSSTPRRPHRPGSRAGARSRTSSGPGPGPGPRARDARVGQDLHVGARNARFQQWQALLDNRTKRNHQGEFLVHGVRPITLAVEHGWPLSALLRPASSRSTEATGATSEWARRITERVRAEQPDVEHVAVAPELLRELGEKSDDLPELLAVARIPADRLDRIDVGTDGLVVAFDRPANPGNIGTLVRSADAFGARGVLVTGHAADVYDPKAVRASTGSLFALPTVRAAAPRDVLAWVADLHADGVPLTVVGTDEAGTEDVDQVDLTGPTLLVVGNETRGMSAAWREACDIVARIPAGGAASSLNAAVAATVVLYEAGRQRRSEQPR